MSTCKTCGSTDFEFESFERVCTSCGDIEDEGALCMVPDGQTKIENFSNKIIDANTRLTNRIRGEGSDASSRRQVCRERLLTDMRRVVKQLVKEPRVVEETMDLVQFAFSKHEGRLIAARKLGIVGACIYFVSAKHQSGLSLSDICKTMNLKMKIINISLKQVKNLCPDFEYERPNIKDLVKKIIDDLATKQYDVASCEAGVSHPDFKPFLENKEKNVLLARVMLLIDLFESMHPYNQPTPQSLITAVVYHAWRSLDTFKLIAFNALVSNMKCPQTKVKMDPSKEESYDEIVDSRAITAKHSISFERFCQLCDLKYSSSGHKIVTKLQSSLLMIGKYLGDVNKMNLPWFLKDIIENSPTLIQEHMRTALPNEKTTDDCTP